MRLGFLTTVLVFLTACVDSTSSDQGIEITEKTVTGEIQISSKNEQRTKELVSSHLKQLINADSGVTIHLSIYTKSGQQLADFSLSEYLKLGGNPKQIRYSVSHVKSDVDLLISYSFIDSNTPYCPKEKMGQLSTMLLVVMLNR